MILTNDLDKCLSFINCQLQTRAERFGPGEAISEYQAVTISRQAGSGGHEVAERLAGYLQAQDGTSRPWAVFDRNLVEKVLADHNLPGRLARFMPEDYISLMSDTMDELFGLHPPSWLLVRKTAETILQLAQLGNVILIGRGANVITAKLPHVFHVRLVGSLEKRGKRLQEVNAIGSKEAVAMAQREDFGRQRYLKKYFGKDAKDPLLYHLVVNTDLISCDEAARIIALEIAPRGIALAT